MMSFEMREKDLLARIGKLKTKSGNVETPLLFPVVNPAAQPIFPRRMREQFGFQALITNAYLLKKHFDCKPSHNDVRRFLDFDGIVMTDSGAYQILVYGDIEATPEEVVDYQEFIGSDIATILDIPTSWNATERHARQTVNETLKRARSFFKKKKRDDILWVGPVQGGKYLNLVAKSAREMRELPFDVYALGSPTEVMQRYRFDVLVDMIMTAKMNLPIDKPLHLFGAGHPFMFALATALGCDLFDSAAYVLYAKENRYMTETGTSRLTELEFFPCTCPRCTSATPREVSEMTKSERLVFLAEHNLYVTGAEVNRIKQAIVDGRLWEHLQMRAHGHPSLLQALRMVKKYRDQIEKHDPAVKESGLFFFDSTDLNRPELVRYEKRFTERYTPPKTGTLVLLPQTRAKPFHKSRNSRELRKRAQREHAESANTHACFYAAPFGVVPIELDEVYPLSQHETALPLDSETLGYVASQVAKYILSASYTKIIFFSDPQSWGDIVLKEVKKACLKKKTAFHCVKLDEKQQSAGTVGERPRRRLRKRLDTS